MNFERDEITLSDIENHIAKHGRKATTQLLTILGQKRVLYDAVMSSEGQVLLRYITNRMDELLETIINSGDDLTEYQLRVEYRVLSNLIRKWAEELATYKRNSDKLKGA